MVTLNFGSTKMGRVLKSGRFPGSMIPDAGLIETDKRIQPKKLTQDQANRLRVHKQKYKHSQKHMLFMRQLMLQGVSLTEAHKRAQTFVGR